MKKDDWDIESAMTVIMSRTVDSRTWAEAVEWLMLHGPQWAKDTIEAASMTATCDCFPEVKPSGMNQDGEICYNIRDLARALGMKEDEVGEKINQLQAESERQLIFDENETKMVQ